MNLVQISREILHDVQDQGRHRFGFVIVSGRLVWSYLMDLVQRVAT